MSLIKTPDDIAKLRVAGKRLAAILRTLTHAVRPGVSTKELDLIAEGLIREGGDEPAFLNYQPYGADFPYPATLCISVNDEVVHGIPSEGRILAEGDIVGLDLGLIHQGVIVDSAVTVPVGTIPPKIEALLAATKEGLKQGIARALPGNRIGDIGHAIESVAKKEKLFVVEELGGHGVGHAVHEDPYIPNYGAPGKGQLLKPGMVLALEPIFNLGTKEVFLDRDGYTYRTADGKPSAHFEHTILITEGEPEVFTIL